MKKQMKNDLRNPSQGYRGASRLEGVVKNAGMRSVRKPKQNKTGK